MPLPANPPNAPDPGRLRAWLTLAGLVLCFSLLNAFASLAIEKAGPLTSIGIAFLLMGGLAAQPMLLGFWVAAGPASLLLRLPGTLAVLATLTLAIAFAARESEVQPEAGAHLLVNLSVAGLVTMACAAIIGAVFRKATRRRVQRHFPDAPERPFQFSIKYLLGLTALCAVLLSLAMSFIPSIRNVAAEPYFSRTILDMTLYGLFELAVCLPAAVVPWAILSSLPMSKLLLRGGLYWSVTSIVGSTVFSVYYPTGSAAMIGYLLGLQAGAAATGFVSAVVLRSAGYRLTRK